MKKEARQVSHPRVTQNARPGKILSSLLLNASTEGAFTTASGRDFHRLHTITVGNTLFRTLLNQGGTILKLWFHDLL